MAKRTLIDYVQDRRDLYISLAKHASDRNNSALCFTYMEVADELDRLIFVITLEHEEEK